MNKSLTAIISVAFLTFAIASGRLCARTVVGGFHIDEEDKGTFSINSGERELFRLTGVASLSFKPDVSMQFGFFKIRKKNEVTAGLNIREVGGGLAVFAGAEETGKVDFSATPGGNLRVRISVDGSRKGNALRLKFACASGDRFWGFGEQYNYIDFKGMKVPIWVQEQGVGRAKKPTLPYVGMLTNSYFPMPYFIDPGAGKGFLIENTEYSEFDLCSEEKDTWSAEVWNGSEVSFLVFPGPAPADVVSQLTAEAGRPKQQPPDWAFSGVWLAAQGGREQVEKRLKTALDAGVPVTAIWAQDWVGLRHFGAGNFGVKYRWSLDEELYPGFSEMIRSMREKNVRFLGYFNPFIVPDFELYDGAVKNSFVVKRGDGSPYDFQIVTFKGGLLDVTNPDAADWFLSFARRATELGISGWMADFGEWLPFDSAPAIGEAPVVHNTYPTLWHELNRRALEEAYPDGDFVMFTRSGYTGEQRVAQIVWAGDQEADWSETDGLPTVVTAGLTIGMSGIPYFTHDIAGFSGGPSTKELFQRWTELGAFTPFMRTHDGLQKMKNHRFDTDADTLAHFTRFARIHVALTPYFKALARESVETGLPIIRHTALVDPEWKESYDANGQWMLGADMLFAPVVKKGAETVEVKFPAGEWEHLLTGERYKGRQVTSVIASVGTPAVFVRSGKSEDILKAVREILKSTMK